MLKKLLFLLLSVSGILTANCCNNCPCMPCGSGWYGTVGAGYAWSFHPNIKNPDPGFWAPAAEGFDAPLGNAPFFTIGFGKMFCNLWSLDIFYTYFQTFHYEKFQTGPTVIVGTRRTRFFDLDPQNVMFNLSLIPRDCFSYSLCCMDFTPVLGVGIGVGINRISNFRTIAFTETTPPVGSTTSIGFPRTTTSFAWQATAGLRLTPSCTPLNIDILYRYFDGGRFKGPSRVVDNNVAGLGGFLSGKPWKGRFRANELMLTLNYLF